MSWRFNYPDLPLHHWLMLLVHQAQILNGDAGLLQGSRSSVVRASTAKVGGLGFDSQWLPKFFPSVCFYSDLPPVVYQQFLLPVVVIRIITKIVMYNKVVGFPRHGHMRIQTQSTCMYVCLVCKVSSFCCSSIMHMSLQHELLCA